MRLLAQSGPRACMWDITTGAKTLDCALSPHYLWWGTADVKRMWESLSGCPAHTFNGHSGTFMLSYGGTQLVSSASSEQDQDVVELWNTYTGERVHAFADHSGTVPSVAFSLDGLRIVSGSDDNTIRVWDVTTGDLLHTCEGHEGPVHALAFSPDARRIASGSLDETVRVWDASTGKQLKVLKGHWDMICSVAFSPDGSFIFSGSLDYTIRVWDADTGAHLHTFDLHGSEPSFRSLSFTPDGCGIVVGPENRAIRLWRGESADENNSNISPSEHGALGRPVWPAYWLEPDGWLFSFSPTRTRRLCWIPAEWRDWVASQGDIVVLLLRNVREALVILDFAALHTYLDYPDSERND
ncbi:Vegetative incompatibility protein HET-E-1 [Grifola frondosa]|uniref:Vegetative incompatibility protein HET-E-1 n=1 Tax=Grifola frondosa TaxID=5627 RepID=A0A1C7MFC9_GRIFR|nr:Vegetative incompatibility protein HET-E-1 [Grifola frondosa]